MIKLHWLKTRNGNFQHMNSTAFLGTKWVGILT